MNNQRKQQRILATILIFVLMSLIGISILIKQSVKEESYFDYTDEDVKMLGDFMYAEILTYNKIGYSLDNEEYEDVKYAYMLTGSVVLHRLESRLFGETMEQVIFAPTQYSPYTQEAIGNIDTPAEVYEWAEELLKYGPKGPEDLIFESCFKMGFDTYWELNGKIYFCTGNVTKKVEGGKVN